MTKIKLICIPYAGGSANGYLSWKPYLPENIELCPIELRGRGNRFSEELYETMDDAIEDVFGIISSMINDTPYIILGYSMGSIIAYEVATRISLSGMPAPLKLIVAGIRPPHLVYKDARYTHLPIQEFMTEIVKLGQTSKEIIEDRELFDIFSEILYKDFYINENYKPSTKIHKLNVPIYALAGLQDEEAPEDDIKEWAKYTNVDFYIYLFKGDHFFGFKEDLNYFYKLRDIILTNSCNLV